MFHVSRSGLVVCLSAVVVMFLPLIMNTKVMEVECACAIRTIGERVLVQRMRGQSIAAIELTTLLNGNEWCEQKNKRC